jgi:PST family polysaccharide transporter
LADDTPLKELGQRSVRGGLITIASQAVTVFLQLASTVVLARMLTPDDYGVMGMVLSFVALASIFKDLGLSSAAIQRAGLTTDQQTNLFWINSLFGLFLSGVVACASPLIAWFFGRPELIGMTWILSLTFVIAGLGAQHNAMMVRNMLYGRMGLINVLSIAVTFAVSVTLASLGFSFWSLAWGHVAGATARTALTWWFSPFLPGLWKNGVGSRSLINFGANVTGFNIVNYFSRNLDNILIGKFAGAEALGIYGRAYQLMLFPIQNLRGPIDAVTYPVLCRLQGRPEDWRAYHMQTLKVIALLSMPLVAWMFLVSEPLILLLLGENWAGVIPIFQALAMVAFIQPSLSVVGPLLLSLGRSRDYLWLGMTNAFIYSAGFAIGVQFGAQGIANSFVVSTYIVLVPSYIFTYWGTNAQILDFFRSIAFPTVGSLAATSITLTLLQIPTLSSVLDRSLWLDLIGRSTLFFFFVGALLALTKSGRMILWQLRTIIIRRNDEFSSN